MKEKDLPFFRLAMQYSQQWADHFRTRELTPEMQAQYNRENEESLKAQTDTENADTMGFDAYLKTFYAQYSEL